jgi:hypothetical protein
MFICTCILLILTKNVYHFLILTKTPLLYYSLILTTNVYHSFTRGESRQLLSYFAQVMYDKSDEGRHLKTFTGCALAQWHNYKWATSRICVVFGNEFVGPFFHNLFPDHAFDPKKMSHPSLTSILSIMRLSYPSFRDNLVAARQTADLPIRSRNLLTNMFHLFEIYIPVVSFVVHNFVSW